MPESSPGLASYHPKGFICLHRSCLVCPTQVSLPKDSVWLIRGPRGDWMTLVSSSLRRLQTSCCMMFGYLWQVWFSWVSQVQTIVSPIYPWSLSSEATLAFSVPFYGEKDSGSVDLLFSFILLYGQCCVCFFTQSCLSLGSGLSVSSAASMPQAIR